MPGRGFSVGKISNQVAGNDGQSGSQLSNRYEPLFLINARVDKLTPADKCVDFYAVLLKADVNAELHVFNKGGHGFDLGLRQGKATALWTASFLAWLQDINMIQP